MDVSAKEDDARIVELYLNRDEAAVSRTERKYKNLCLSIARNILKNDQDCEECVNDTLLRVWNSIPPAKPDNLRAYICKIARNLALSRLKFNTRQKRAENFAVSFDEIDELLPDSRMNPERDDQELARAIDCFLGTLKPSVRSVFLRRYWYFDSTRDIMERYSFSESKVHNILYHTRSKLRDYLKKEGFYL